GQKHACRGVAAPMIRQSPPTAPRHGWPIGAVLALTAFSLAVPWSLGCALHAPSIPPHRRIDVALVRPPHTLADQDGDGLPDALEDALLRKYSPSAAIAGSETAWPASV